MFESAFIRMHVVLMQVLVGVFCLRNVTRVTCGPLTDVYN